MKTTVEFNDNEYDEYFSFKSKTPWAIVESYDVMGRCKYIRFINKDEATQLLVEEHKKLFDDAELLIMEINQLKEDIETLKKRKWYNLF